MPLAKINDININYEVKGQGVPVVLISGLASTVAENQWLVDILAQKYRVLSFDNRGAGLSDKPRNQYSIEMMSKDAISLMQETNFNNAAVIGISMGGRIALDLVLRQPEMVNKLVLVSTSARVVSSSRSGLMLNFFHLLPLSRDMQPHYAFARQMEASRLYDASARLSEINIPVIILHGKTDKIVPDYLAEEFHTGIRSSKMVTLPGGHLFFMLRSRRPFLEELLRFLG